MKFYNLHVLDVSIILVYLVVCLVIGYLTSKKVKNIKDYAIGSGGVSTAVLVGTFFATDIGAGDTVGTMAKVQTAGLLFLVAAVLRPLFWLVASFLFSKNIGYFKEAGCLTLSDIMEVTYGKTGRWICNIASFGFAVGVVALQVIALNYMLKYFLGIASVYCALLTFSILTIYSMMGGIKAVALTDLLQAVVFLVGLPLACFLALDSFGASFSEILESLPETHKSFDLSGANILLLSGIVMRSMLNGTEAPFIQRYLMANNESQLKQVMRECFYLALPFAIIVVTCGLVVTATSDSTIDSNTAFYYLIDHYLPIGVKGLVITGMLAVIMSTADSWLNTASVMCAHDILGNIFPNATKKTMLLIARISTMLIGFIGALFAISYSKGLTDFMWLIDGLWAPIVISPLIYAMFVKKSNSQSFIVASIMSLIGVVVGFLITNELARVSTSMGIVFSAIGLLGARYYQGIRSNPQQVINSVRYAMLAIIKLLFIRYTFNQILDFSAKQVQENGRNYYLTGMIGIMFFISSLFFFDPDGNSEMLLYMRSIAAVMSLLLMFHEHFNLKFQQQKYIALYYHIVLLIVFPLTSGYMAIISGFSSFWMISFALAIIMMNFICGATITAILTVIGVALSFIIWQSTGSNMMAIPPSMVHIGSTIILMIVTARFRHNFQRYAVEVRDMYLTMIAHQVMQPIAQVQMSAEHIQGILASYTKKDAKKSFYAIDEDDLKEVNRTVNALRKIGCKSTELV
ncbi:MAG: sodium:solute symporter, partial [Alphaproteobacteria bacterium]